MPNGTLCRWQNDSAKYSETIVGQKVTNIVNAEDGCLLVAGIREVFKIDQNNSIRHAVAIDLIEDGCRFNDGSCDSKGRLWIGTMYDNLGQQVTISPLPRVGSILCLDSQGYTSKKIGNLGCPNAIVWSPDDKTMYFADSSDGCIYSYDYDGDTGQLSEKKVFFHSPELGIPDGAAVDVAGHIWNARWGVGCVIRLCPKGQLQQVIKVDAKHVTSCAFGDSDLKTLYITSASDSAGNGGFLFKCRVDVPGIEKNRFRS